MATVKLSIKQAESLAAKWGTTSRTIFNWRNRGVDLTSDLDVLCFVVGSKNPTQRQLAAAADILARKLPDSGGYVAGLRNGLLESSTPSI